ncbi:MAG TPA: glycosyltransferase family 4 protein, partial [Candidatus Acidoferrum sp.]|nr:glycosyltransferase family 4 protein [Candidatus Acidoferrum sp.]
RDVDGPMARGQGAPTIGLIGRLEDSMKGHTVFVQAAKEVAGQRQGVRFCIIGDGPDRSKLESLVSEFGLGDRLVFTGEVIDLRRAFGMVDIVVIASRSESLPHVLLEAMFCGKSIIATAVGDMPLVLGEPYAGFIVPKDDSPALARRLMDLIDHPESIAQSGTETRRRFEELGLTAERCARETEEVYASLVSAASKPRPISRKLLVGIGGFLLLETYWAVRRRLSFGRPA